MKKLKRLTAVMMILIMGISTIVCGNTIKSYASTAQFTISLSSSTVKKGSTVKVTVKLSCSEAIGAYTYCLTYDSSILEYSSGDGSGGGGTIKCAGYGDGSSTSASNSFTFNAIGTGSSYVGTSSAEVYSWSESLCSASNAGATVSVTASGSSGSTTTETATTTETGTTEGATDEEDASTTEDTTEETTEELSDNCQLASLEISPGELDPEFSSDVYTYETTVSSDVTSLAINAIADDAKSTVSITGNANFEPGDTYHITITVTAETGDSHIYDLLVTVEETVDTRYVLTVDGTDYYFTEDYSKLNIPEGFAEDRKTIEASEVILYTSPNGLISCAYLTDEDGNNGAWYIVDLDAGTIAPFISVLSSYTTFIILEPDETVSVPDGYTTFTYELSGNEITACHYDETDDIILVYAMTADTEPAWYRYDTEMKTFVRYVADYKVNAADTDSTDEDESFFEEHKIAIIVVCALVFLIMLVLIITLAILLKKSSPDNEPDGNGGGDGDDFIDEASLAPSEAPVEKQIAEEAVTEEASDEESMTVEPITVENPANDETAAEEPATESERKDLADSLLFTPIKNHKDEN